MEDLDKILKNSVNASLKHLKEAFVADKKTFRQVSEFVSQKTKEMHYSLYEKCILSFNAISAKLDTARRTQPDMFASLKKEETKSLNSVWLHELYFSNCFDPNSEIIMDSLAYIELSKRWGTFEDWQKDFIACAMNTSGWVLCSYNLYLKQFVNTIITEDSNDVLLGTYPVIVIDMHEHAYTKDYLSDKQSYLIALMRELNWNIIEERIKTAKTIMNLR